jgi:hypothetical protein
MIINKTPHAVHLIVDGKTTTFPPHAKPARVSEHMESIPRHPLAPVHPVYRVVRGNVIDIPFSCVGGHRWHCVGNEGDGYQNVCSHCGCVDKTGTLPHDSNLPDRPAISIDEPVFYIVSSLVAAACPERTDLLVPGNAVRDADGKIIGCKCFISPAYHPTPPEGYVVIRSDDDYYAVLPEHAKRAARAVLGADNEEDAIRRISGDAFVFDCDDWLHFDDL